MFFKKILTSEDIKKDSLIYAKKLIELTFMDDIEYLNKYRGEKIKEDDEFSIDNEMTSRYHMINGVKMNDKFSKKYSDNPEDLFVKLNNSKLFFDKKDVYINLNVVLDYLEKANVSFENKKSIMIAFDPENIDVDKKIHEEIQDRMDNGNVLKILIDRHLSKGYFSDNSDEKTEEDNVSIKM